MIASLTGIVQASSQGSCVLDVSGVGYQVAVTAETAATLRLGEHASLMISMVVREDAMLLFGFLDFEARDLFDILRGVSGVGPKTALAILNQLSPAEIGLAVAEQQDAVFAKVSGIGPKTAKLLVVALGGRLKGVLTATSKPASDSEVVAVVTAALTGLGIPERVATEAISLAEERNAATSRDALLRAALAIIGESKGNK